MKDVYFELIQEGETCRWNQSEDFCILYILKGNAEILCRFGRYLLQPEDFITIEQREPYLLETKVDTTILAFYVNLSLLRFQESLLLGKRVFCCSVQEKEEKEKKYEKIRMVMARLFEAMYKEENEGPYQIYAEIMSLMGIFYTAFSIFKGNNIDKMQERESRILQYLEDHYSEEIGLSRVAEKEHLSIAFLSRYFHKTFGMTFVRFLKNIRLSHAYTDLISTKKQITQIAQDNGFASTNAFIEAFREQYGMPPGVYRKKINEENKNTFKWEKANKIEYNDDIYYAIRKYGAREVVVLPENKISFLGKTQHIIVNMSAKKTVFPTLWKNMLGEKNAKELLLTTVQEQIRKCQNEIGFYWMRIGGLFEKNMGIELGEQNQYDFRYIDLIFDFILSLSMKPYVDLSYMTSEIKQKEAENTALLNQKWCEAVQKLLMHLIERYGKRKILSWRFTCGSVCCNDCGEEQYFDTYRRLWSMIKCLLPKAEVGGPGSTDSLLTKEGKKFWIRFFKMCDQEKCMPDFITVHSIESEQFYEQIKGMRQFVKKKTSAKLPIIIEEWNYSRNEYDEKRDTCFQAVFLADHIMRLASEVDGLCIEPLFDSSATGMQHQPLFYGGKGMIGSYGLEKSSYHVLALLNLLGNQLVYKQEGCYITQRENGFTILAYDSTYLKASTEKEIEMQVTLENLDEGEYQMELYSVSPDNGSVYDAWLKTGKHEKPPEDSAYLKVLTTISKPYYELSNKRTKNGKLTISFRMQRWKVIFLFAKHLENEE